MRRACLLSLALVATASAQPAPQDTSKLDATQLNRRGVELLEQKDYISALAVFKEAYARYHSAKILLNLGTTLKLLDRKAEAANAYQRYLDDKDVDPARRAEVVALVAELDKSVGRVHLSITPADGVDVQIASDEWHPSDEVGVWRVEPGTITVHARRDGYQPATKTQAIAANQDVTVAIALVAVEKPKAIVITAPIEREKPRSRFGARATMHVSVTPKIGSAAIVGATADVLPKLEVDAGLILGPGLVSPAPPNGMYTIAPPSIGAYVGASYVFLLGKARPLLAAGFPIFDSNGLRFGLRGAAGVELVVARQLSLTIELGVETSLNPEVDIHPNIAFVPAFAVAGRL